jgi:hypothetical protein
MTKALSWSVIGVVIPAVLALGAGFVLAGDNMKDFNIAHGCFLLAFLLIGAKVIHLLNVFFHLLNYAVYRP